MNTNMQHWAVILISGTISASDPIITGYARSFPNDLAMIPVVDDLQRWAELCASFSCAWDAIEVTEQWEDGTWRLPLRTIPVPPFGGA